jgi:hypothetical protein
MAGSGSVTRNDCVIPAGKALFFPILNAIDFHVSCSQDPDPNVCDSNDTPDLVWDNLQSLGFSASNLSARVNGKQIQGLDPATSPYRACAGPVTRCNASAFTLTLPSNNLFGLPADSYAPSVADGYYLLLPPLTPGHHTIVFGGVGSFGGSVSQSITYNLTVKS